MKKYEYNDQAFSIYDFLSSNICKGMIARAETKGFEPALINDGMGQSERPDVRNNQRIIFDDLKLATNLWAKLERHVTIPFDGWKPAGLNERFRFYKYDRFQTFKWHRDLPYKRNDDEQSHLTFMIYLNSDYEGGFTDFESFKIWPETGMALIFNHKLRHEGAYITSGTKYVLRSDVMYRRTSI